MIELPMRVSSAIVEKELYPFFLGLWALCLLIAFSNLVIHILLAVSCCNLRVSSRVVRNWLKYWCFWVSSLNLIVVMLLGGAGLEGLAAGVGVAGESRRLRTMTGRVLSFGVRLLFLALVLMMLWGLGVEVGFYLGVGCFLWVFGVCFFSYLFVCFSLGGTSSGEFKISERWVLPAAFSAS